MKRRSLTFRFVVLSLVTCAITSPLLMILVGCALYFGKSESLNEFSLSAPGRIMLQTHDDVRSSDFSERLASMVTPPGFQSNEIWIVDAKGRVFSTNSPNPLPVPGEAYADLPEEKTATLWQYSSYERQVVARRIGNDKNLYLVMRNRYQGSALERVVWGIMIFAALGSLCVAALVIGVFFIFFRLQARRVRGVLADLRAGKLDSRFQVDRLDEIGNLMVTFNEMADEIQSLVLKLRSSEQERTSMLQFLAHDIRTPLTSLRLIADDIATAKAKDLKTRKRSSQLLNRELSLFEKYAEDLFFLAQIRKRDSTSKKMHFNLSDLVHSEVDRFQGLSRKTQFDLTADSECPLFADRAMMQRMLQNVLSNASRYARKKVKVSLKGGAQYVLEITDDGVGFSGEGLESFGQRRPLRYRAGAEKDAGVSLGLGSVILVQIVESYGGKVEKGNWTSKNGSVGGAKITIYLPRPESSRQAA